jgi:hypothetical protein
VIAAASLLLPVAEIPRLPRGPGLTPELAAAVDGERFSGDKSSRGTSGAIFAGGNGMTISTESFSMIDPRLVCRTQYGPYRMDVTAQALKRVANMAPALQASIELYGGEMHALSRAGILSRYRRYSDIRKDIQTAALENVADSRFLAHAKRVGLSDGKVLFTDDDVELTLVFDLALYTAQPGRTRAIDRCARRRLSVSTPDEAFVLQGLQASRFSIFRTIGRCEPAGVLLEDLMRGGTICLLDEGLEQSARPGEVFAMRVAPIEAFVITCGAVVPLDSETFEEIIDFLTDGAPGAELAALADDRRFAASLYELAIELGLMSFVAYR